MDKYEYKVRADEIKELISLGEYVQAAEIADTIDWRRVKSVMMLCTISDLYKINRRYEDARDMLLLAYERRPGGRTICYSLCELSIKMEEFVQAIEYYKEFVQVAPKDSGRYILQYKLYEAQDVSLEERIAVLEELKKRDYREKWAYELAYLYHRVGLAARCVEECDELILWFGEGKYVIKAMELKMLHQPLTAEQQVKYDNRFGAPAQEQAVEETVAADAVYEEPVAQEQSMATQIYEPVEQTAPEQIPVTEPEELDIQVKTMDMGEYNTINLQAELAAGLREVLAEEKASSRIEDSITRSIMAPMLDTDTESLDYPEIDEVSEDDLEPNVEEMESSEVFFGETAEIGDLQQEIILPEEEVVAETAVEEETSVETTSTAEVAEQAVAQPQPVPDNTAEIVMEQLRQEIAQDAAPQSQSSNAIKDNTEQEKVLHTEPPKELASVLTQGADGQLSLVMPERENIEKQITGQMSIEDILAEWERMKKENQEKREAEIRQHVLQQTGAMFTEFEAAVRDGLLEQLEREKTVEEPVVEAEPAVEEPVTEEFVAEELADEESVEEEAVIEEPAVEEAAVEETFIEETTIEEATIEEATIEEATEEQPATEEVQDEQPEEVLTEADEVEELEEIAEVQEEAVTDAIETEVVETEKTVTEAAEPAVEEAVEEYAEVAAEELTPEPPTPDEVVRDQAKVRALTREEKELFGPYIQSKSAKMQLVKCIDNISLAAYTGNVIITGAEGMDTLTLAKNMIREIQNADSNFSGKVAKISGAALNNKNVTLTIDKLKNGALIITKASEMNDDTVKALYKCLQQEALGIIIVMEDVKKAMDKFLAENEQLKASFTARMDVEALSNDTLVAFGKQYAREREYAIDDLGILALHTRIEELQTIDHVVTVVEVKEIVDEAIRHVKRKTLGHFFDVLLAKRYDDEDMIILSEKDFV